MQDKQKVLVHLHRPFLPTDSGDKKRVLGILNYFKSRQNNFSIEAIVRNPYRRKRNVWLLEDKQKILHYAGRLHVYEINKNWLNTIHSRSQTFYYQRLLGQLLPVDSDYYTPPGYVRFAQRTQASQAFTHVWINYSENAHLGLGIKAKFPQVKVFLDMHDLGAKVRLERQRRSPEGSFLKRLKFDYEANLRKEANIISGFDKVIVNSLDELAVLEQYLPQEKLVTLPHLIDDLGVSKVTTLYSKRDFKYDFLFVGSEGEFNIDAANFFLEQVYPLILEQIPEARLAIAGKVSQAIQLNSTLKNNVDLLGFVPSLMDVYLSSKVFVCPLLNGIGTKVKLQEAMSYGLPIVTTSVGASGLKLTNHLNAFITNDAEQFAQHTLELLRNLELAQAFSRNITEVFQAHYSNEAVYQQLDHLFEVNRTS